LTSLKTGFGWCTLTGSNNQNNNFMPYASFHTYFPEIASKETRCIQIFSDQKLADDNFILMELFCDEQKCDCRRVMLNVFSEKRKEFVAVINYGWESEKYYENWFGSYDKEIIYELKGPSINTLSVRTDITEEIFYHIKMSNYSPSTNIGH
jgi:hypothetical protein